LKLDSEWSILFCAIPAVQSSLLLRRTAAAGLRCPPAAGGSRLCLS
jgi:hypothetical protein